MNDPLSRDERRSLSPEQWRAHHARADIEKARPNLPPSLKDFTPSLPPAPKLESANDTGKLAPHVAAAPLTHSMAEKLRSLPAGSFVTVNPEAKPEVKQYEPPESEATDRPKQQKKKTILSSLKRREALEAMAKEGLSAASERFDVTQGALSNWMALAGRVAHGQALPETYPLIHGITTQGSTRETALAIFNAYKERRPRERRSRKGEASSELVSDLESRVAALTASIAEREATLAGFKHELDKLRASNAELEKHNATLRATLERLTEGD
jgi:uncharacterized small protein (DUF1192 family)